MPSTPQETVIAQLSVFNSGMPYASRIAYDLLDQAAGGRPPELPKALGVLSSIHLEAEEIWRQALRNTNEIARREQLLGNLATFAPELDEIAQGAPRPSAGVGFHSRVFHLETTLNDQRFVAKVPDRIDGIKRWYMLHLTNDYVKNLSATLPCFEQLQAVSFRLPAVIAPTAAGLAIEELPESDVEAIGALHIREAVENLVVGGLAGHGLDRNGAKNVYFGASGAKTGFTFLDYYSSNRGSTERAKVNLKGLAELLLRAGKERRMPLTDLTPREKENRAHVLSMLHAETAQFLPAEPEFASRMHYYCRRLGDLCRVST